MPLWKAILEGAKKRPQNTSGGYWGRLDDSACAAAGAMEAIGVAFGGYVTFDAASAAFPVAYLPHSPVCDCDRECGSVWWTAIHLNDHHFWTRERIAEWVRGIEEPAAPLPSYSQPLPESK